MNTENRINPRMKELITILNKANYAYEQGSHEIMSNHEYDTLYNQLEALEKETGIILSQSPTQKVGYEVVSKLPKETHAEPMLSLDKTKEESTIIDFFAGRDAVLSWKLDGLTLVLTYKDGHLEKAVTRGNGTVGEVVTNNARAFLNIPLVISSTDDIVVRGEALISYVDFEKINATITEAADKYKNPRNLCSGSVRQLDANETAKRHVQFVAFSLVSGKECETRMEELAWLESEGFDVVEHVLCTSTNTVSNMLSNIHTFKSKITENALPSDGLVVQFNDVAYGKSLGTTSKYPKDALAFKWEDEEKETTLREIEWSASRTGLINPVAIFDPVELEGTTVTRASVHNVSIMENLELSIGDTITVYKANMIIPQIADNLTRLGTCEIPTTCPVCGGKTTIKQAHDAKTLYCTEPLCQAKRVGSFVHFVKRDAMNIDGLSEATLEKLINAGFIKTFADIYHLADHKAEIEVMEGFGERSYTKLIASIEASRNTTMPRVLYALGIDNVGRTVSKLIAKTFNYDITKAVVAKHKELLKIDGLGDVIVDSFVDYFDTAYNQTQFINLFQELVIEQPDTTGGSSTFDGLTFVITGSVEHFKNRDEIKDVIEQQGGKVSGSVSAKTNYLINNDVTSSSSKNKKARDLGIPIISEQDFLTMLN